MENKKQINEKKTISLGETIDILENKMTSSLVETYETSGKRYKTLSLVSGLVGATSAMLVAGNLALGGNTIDIIANTGSTVAMASYAVGNAFLAAHSYKKAKRVKESFNEELSELSALRSKLEILKEKLEYNKINGLMYSVAGTGFCTTFISQLFRPENQIRIGEGFVIFSAVLAGLVGVGTAVVAKKSISTIRNTKLDITSTQEDIKIAEEKDPEEIANANKAMHEAFIAQQENSKGRTFK